MGVFKDAAVCHWVKEAFWSFEGATSP